VLAKFVTLPLNAESLERAKTQVADIHDKIEDDRAGGATLEQAAQKEKLPLVTYTVDRSGRDPDAKPIANLIHAPNIINAAFASDVGVDNDPIDADGGYVWYDVAAITPARDRTLDEVKDQVTQRWRNDEIASRLKTKAADLLDKAGWKPGTDGIREKDGKKLSYLFQTSINQPRQETQQIIKQACKRAGIDIRLKAVLASVYFSSDTGNDDTYPKFYTDLQMYTTGPNQPDPGFWMQLFLSSQVASKANKWQGRNITRWQNAEYDRIYVETVKELDPVKRAALFIQLNDLVIDNVVVIPVIFRKGVGAAVNGLHAPLSGWDNDTWDLPDWYKETRA